MLLHFASVANVVDLACIWPALPLLLRSCKLSCPPTDRPRWTSLVVHSGEQLECINNAVVVCIHQHSIFKHTCKLVERSL
jgi:hypothetical protein